MTHNGQVITYTKTGTKDEIFSSNITHPRLQFISNFLMEQLKITLSIKRESTVIRFTSSLNHARVEYIILEAQTLGEMIRVLVQEEGFGLME